MDVALAGVSERASGREFQRRRHRVGAAIEIVQHLGRDDLAMTILFFIAILAGRLCAEGENLVRVLAHNKRLEILPLIYRQFEAL